MTSSSSLILQHYIKLTEFLGKALGPDYEVALHDLTRKDRSIIAIANNYISGREGRFTLRRQKGVYLHCICVFHPDVCLRTFQSPWAARYQRMTLTLALPGQVRLKVRSIPVRDAAPCLNALEQKT